MKKGIWNSFVFRSAYSITTSLVGVALLVLAVWHIPAVVTTVMDWNLEVIKWACSFFAADTAGQIETALRLGLGADKALIFAESAAIVNFTVHVITKLCAMPFRKQ